MSAVAVSVTARGRVQGVFFRESVRRRAEQRGVAGWVANRSDGSVEALFEGPEDAVRALVEFCREGPRSAEVSQLEERPVAVEGIAGFSVR
ncbi:MAG TPA: acylphosphatase [Longimicrobiales bacterium]|nr:acylphosphatase [Longimicrobiales bacterium]